MTRRDWLLAAATTLNGLDSPRRCAELILARTLGISRLKLVTDPMLPLPPEAEATLNQLLERRRSGEPLAYILGEKEFYGRTFAVTPATLIPRPETEHLVDEALRRVSERPLRFIDLGTGSGCLAITLAAERPLWRGMALDISEDALETARQNAVRHDVQDRLELLCADFSKPGFWNAGQAGLDLVISNPPYISEAEYVELGATVREFEPKSALVPGESGLELMAQVVAAAAHILRPGGVLLMEHGAAQGAAARDMCGPERWKSAGTGLDLAGLERFLIAEHR